MFKILALVSWIVIVYWGAVGFCLLFTIPGAIDAGFKPGIALISATAGAWTLAAIHFAIYARASAVEQMIGRIR